MGGVGPPTEGRRMSKPPRRFAIRCSRAEFTEEEIQTLEKYGQQFTELIDGRRPCKTAAQERFVEAANGQREPETYYERVWHKYTERKESEHQNHPRSMAGKTGAVSRTPSCTLKGKRVPNGQPRYRRITDPPPNMEPARSFSNDRDDWKRMRRSQWTDTIRRVRGD